MPRLPDEILEDMAKWIILTVEEWKEQGINVFELAEVKGSDNK